MWLAVSIKFRKIIFSSDLRVCVFFLSLMLLSFFVVEKIEVNTIVDDNCL